MILTEVCQYLRNWFTRAKYIGKFTIENGELQTEYDTGTAFDTINVLPGQYVRIINSNLNDGVHQYPCYDLKDEVFDGAVWTMSVPAALLDISKEINDWQDKYSGADSPMMSPYQSESFGGYSYTKESAGSAESNGSVSWQTKFYSRLSPWRKI